MSGTDRRTDSVPNAARVDHVGLIVRHLQKHRDPASVPPVARDAAKTFLFDSIGVALAGASVSESTLVLEAVSGWGQVALGGTGAHVWGSPSVWPAPTAALINAFHIHNQEFDCVHERAVVHPMAVILAAMMAGAERQQNVSGTKFLAALAIAVDVATVIGMTATEPIRFFRPAQCGCLGAVAGLAYLEGLDEVGIKNALGLAYSQLAGTMQAHIEGTPTLALQVAFAARAAVCAIDLAKLGFRAPHDVLDGRYGYFALIENGAADTASFRDLGVVWQITRVSHKPYPTGRAAQGGIAGLIGLMKQHGFQAQDVASVVLSAPPLIRQLVDRPYKIDMTVNYARLCLPYLLALTLRDGSVGLRSYTESNLRDTELAALAKRVLIESDGNTDLNALAPQRLTVGLNDGRSFSTTMPQVYGSPDAPMTAEAQRAKFSACCRAAPQPLAEVQIEQLINAIQNIESLQDVSDLVAMTRSN